MHTAYKEFAWEVFEDFVHAVWHFLIGKIGEFILISRLCWSDDQKICNCAEFRSYDDAVMITLLSAILYGYTEVE